MSQRLDGAAIDMPAGPSEVLVIADSGATPDFVASDLLSQAEHGPDSQVILLTPDADMAHQVAEAVERQLAELPRAETARQALSASRLIVTKDLAQCVEISNQYGPEHLIIQTRNARELVDSITSAGSVFLVTGHRNRQVITPPAPTTFCRLTVTPPPVPASGWQISRSV
ncbi:histidinol dehydrogenase [Escherichia coli]|uniref:histidinol dehydrogenase n=1 Tax=Escherichia coli TaxID=562 RepID=A0A377BNP2_ECOLX|nr:histidinol dehydrogenase [Escherichia coli]